MNYDPLTLETAYHRNLRERKLNEVAARVRYGLQLTMLTATLAIFAWLGIQLMGTFESARSMAEIIR